MPNTIPPECDLLQAVLTAIDLPHATTVGDETYRTAILLQRLTHVTAVLRGVLRGDELEWAASYLRSQLDQIPAPGYTTWDQARAELAARPSGVGAT